MNYQWDNSSGEWDNKIPELNKTDKIFFSKVDAKLNQSSSILKENFIISPFEDLINLTDLKSKNILEIGCGFGSHAQLIITNSKECNYTGIDITQKAINYSSRRFDLFNLRGELKVADAEKLPFKSDQFDMVWSWGVIHHSKSTENILSEIKRVLSKNGICKIMVYNKNSLRYYLYCGFFLGLIKGQLFKKSLEQINMEVTDGYFARHFTSNELNKILKILGFRIKKISILPETDHLPFPGGYKLKKFNFKILNKLINYFCKKYGWFLYAEFEKI